jgi:hypothetical protein
MKKCSNYKPLVIKFDDNFSGDLLNATSVIAGTDEDIRIGNHTMAHNRLELAGAIFHFISKTY